MGRLGGVAGLCVGLALSSTWVLAGEVQVETKDGTTYTGQIVKETNETLVIAVRQGALKAEVTIFQRDISRRHDIEPKITLRQALAPQVDQARSQEDPAQRAEKLLELARRIELEGDPAEAARLYLEAGRTDPALRDQTDPAAAGAYASADQLGAAEQILRETLERNPKNAAAATLARRLERLYADKARELIDPGVREYVAGRPRGALRYLQQAARELPHPVLDRASEEVKQETGLTLAEIMVDCRLRATCSHCDGSGVVECPRASGTASLRCRFGRQVRTLRPHRMGKLKVARWEYCDACRGQGHLRCADCRGLGLALHQPTPYEKEEMVETLSETLGGLEQEAKTFLERIDEGASEGALRSVAATEMLGLLQGVQGYSDVLSRLDPRSGAVGGGDRRRASRQAGRRISAVMTGLANALFVVGEQRYEDAVTQNGIGDEQGETVPLAVRATRARQAWELVNQARSYTLEALEQNPGSAGPLAGNLKQRLSLMEAFLTRTWKTYQGLRALEDESELRGGQGTLEELVERAQKQTARTGGPSMGGPP